MADLNFGMYKKDVETSGRREGGGEVVGDDPSEGGVCEGEGGSKGKRVGGDEGLGM